jgi:hypothetical protein
MLEYAASNDRAMDEWWIGKDLGRSRRGLSEVVSLQRNQAWEKLGNPPVRTDPVQAEIRTVSTSRIPLKIIARSM